MYCFDKVADKSHPITTKAAAQEPHFYEIPSGSFEDKDIEVPVNTVENALSTVERYWAPLHANLIKSADTGKISASLTIEYAPFLIMQWMRTKTFRDMIHEMSQRSLQSISDDLVELNFPGAGKPKVTLGDTGMSARQSQMIFDPVAVNRMSDDLERHYWIVGINKSKHLFFTSDHPVVRRGNITKGGRPQVGIRDKGFEFVFPLDSRHVLLILEREHFAKWRQHDNKGLLLTEEQVQDYNSLQVLRSSQRVYCAEDDFALARSVCSSCPEIRDPKRPRINVNSSPVAPAGFDGDGSERRKGYMLISALE
jgi:hypothetical protein